MQWVWKRNIRSALNQWVRPIGYSYIGRRCWQLKSREREYIGTNVLLGSLIYNLGISHHYEINKE